MSSPFQVLCYVVDGFYYRLKREEKEAAASLSEQGMEELGQKAEPTRPKASSMLKRFKYDEPCLNGFYRTEKKVGENFDVKSVPNNIIDEYVENTSDELGRKFSFKCIFSPDVCSVVTQSYGNEDKALIDIKRHLLNCHISADAVVEKCKKSKQNGSKSSRKRSYSAINSEALPSCIFPAMPSEAEDVDELSLSKDPDDDNCILRLGDPEHSYAFNPDMEARQMKAPKRKIGVPVEKFDLKKHLHDLSCHKPGIRTPPFPFVYTPCPLEMAQMIEINSNGLPVDYKESLFVQPTNIGALQKKVAVNKLRRKKSKVALTASAARSVLERMENKVAVKSSSSSEQKDVLMPDNSIENSENVDDAREIALISIQAHLLESKKHRRREGLKAYICVICSKHFTAYTSLNHHYLGHYEIKPYYCDICKKSFTRQFSLDYHLMIHANATRFRCEICNKTFRHTSHYKDHMLKHTGAEPFSCKLCPSKFKTRNSFKRHLKIHHHKPLVSSGTEPISTDS